MMRRTLAALLPLVVFVLTACSGGQAPAAAPQAATPSTGAAQTGAAAPSAMSPQQAAPAQVAAAPGGPTQPATTIQPATTVQPAATPTAAGTQPATVHADNPAPLTPPGTGGTTPAAAQRTSTVYPLIVRDHDGQPVTIERKPERVITFAPSNTELVFGLGAGGSVVGVDTYSDWPAAGVAKIAKVGDLFSFQLEQIVALRPDVIFTAPSKDVVPKMKEAGLKVVVLDAATLEQVYENIQLVGRVLDQQDSAANVVADMRARIGAVEARVKGAKEQPKVFYEVWYDPLMSAGPGSFIHDMIQRAGGSNVAAGTGQAYPNVSLEAMVAADPRLIITTDAQWAKDVMAGKYPAWMPTTAMMTSHIYVVAEAILDHPSQRLADGFEALAKLIHPELYTNS